MATATYFPIATQTLGGSTNSITFSSIPNTYTDLRIVFLIPSAISVGDSWLLQFNGDTGANYASTELYSTGSTPHSYLWYSNYYAYLSDAAQSAIQANPKLITIDIFSYANNTNKSLLSKMAYDQNGTGGVNAIVNLWLNTSAITSIKLYNGSTDNFVAGTTATLWGI